MNIVAGKSRSRRTAPDDSGDVRVLIADDEQLARKLLKNLVGLQGGISVCGLAASGAEALQLIERESPDLVFLDIKMPGLDGIELARIVNRMPVPPFVVFVTAFEGYAVPAFELDALDYLVKPVNRERFGQTVQRAKKAISTQRIRMLGEKIAAASTPDADDERYVVVRQCDDLIRIPESQILWLEAASQYVRIHTANNQYIVAEPLSRYHARLKSESFLRVHRSAVVNTMKIVRVRKMRNGVHQLRLVNGASVPVSRSRKTLVDQLLSVCAQRENDDS